MSTSCADHRRPSASTYSVACGTSVGRATPSRPSPRTTPPRTCVGDVLPRPVLVVGAVDDLVVDVGDVRDQPHRRGRSTRGSGAGRRRRASPGRGRGAAGRTPSGRTGRCPPCRARAWRARGPPGWRCRTGAAWAASLGVGDREPPMNSLFDVERRDRTDDDRGRRLDRCRRELRQRAAHHVLLLRCRVADRRHRGVGREATRRSAPRRSMPRWATPISTTIVPPAWASACQLTAVSPRWR